jgi:MFS family permease
MAGTVARSEERRSGRSNRYLFYLVAMALGGWTLATYDQNLLVVSLPNIAQDLHLSSTAVGAIGLWIYGATVVVGIVAGYMMDRVGRRTMWQVCLVAAAAFTALTFLVQNYWQLVLVRVVATAFASTELGVSITLVTEELGPRYRGILYSVVQGGWPLGVFLASGVYLATIHLGWRAVFLFGVAPLVFVIIARTWIREPNRYLHVREIRQARSAGDEERVRELLDRYEVDVSEVDKVTFGQLLGTPGYVRRQVMSISVVWVLYAAMIVPTNIYITYWLTEYKHWSAGAAATLLLVSSGIGYFFYLLGGWLGDRFGRKRVLVGSAALVPVFALVFLVSPWFIVQAVTYFLLYQVSNGTWSGAGYTYWGESVPTRVRGTAMGWCGAMLMVGQLVGSGLWTLLIGTVGAVWTWLILAVAVGIGQAVLTIVLLRNIKPGTELEEIAV